MDSKIPQSKRDYICTHSPIFHLEDCKSELKVCDHYQDLRVPPIFTYNQPKNELDIMYEASKELYKNIVGEDVPLLDGSVKEQEQRKIDFKLITIQALNSEKLVLLVYKLDAIPDFNKGPKKQMKIAHDVAVFAIFDIYKQEVISYHITPASITVQEVKKHEKSKEIGCHISRFNIFVSEDPEYSDLVYISYIIAPNKVDKTINYNGEIFYIAFKPYNTESPIAHLYRVNLKDIFEGTSAENTAINAEDIYNLEINENCLVFTAPVNSFVNWNVKDLRYALINKKFAVSMTTLPKNYTVEGITTIEDFITKMPREYGIVDDDKASDIATRTIIISIYQDATGTNVTRKDIINSSGFVSATRLSAYDKGNAIEIVVSKPSGNYISKYSISHKLVGKLKLKNEIEYKIPTDLELKKSSFANSELIENSRNNYNIVSTLFDKKFKNLLPESVKAGTTMFMADDPLTIKRCMNTDEVKYPHKNLATKGGIIIRGSDTENFINKGSKYGSQTLADGVSINCAYCNGLYLKEASDPLEYFDAKYPSYGVDATLNGEYMIYISPDRKSLNIMLYTPFVKPGIESGLIRQDLVYEYNSIIGDRKQKYIAAENGFKKSPKTMKPTELSLYNGMVKDKSVVVTPSAVQTNSKDFSVAKSGKMLFDSIKIDLEYIYEENAALYREALMAQIQSSGAIALINKDQNLAKYEKMIKEAQKDYIRAACILPRKNFAIVVITALGRVFSTEGFNKLITENKIISPRMHLVSYRQDFTYDYDEQQMYNVKKNEIVLKNQGKAITINQITGDILEFSFRKIDDEIDESTGFEIPIISFSINKDENDFPISITFYGKTAREPNKRPIVNAENIPLIHIKTYKLASKETDIIEENNNDNLVNENEEEEVQEKEEEEIDGLREDKKVIELSEENKEEVVENGEEEKENLEEVVPIEVPVEKKEEEVPIVEKNVEISEVVEEENKNEDIIIEEEVKSDIKHETDLEIENSDEQPEILEEEKELLLEDNKKDIENLNQVEEIQIEEKIIEPMVIPVISLASETSEKEKSFEEVVEKENEEKEKINVEEIIVEQNNNFYEDKIEPTEDVILATEQVVEPKLVKEIENNGIEIDTECLDNNNLANEIIDEQKEKEEEEIVEDKEISPEENNVPEIVNNYVPLNKENTEVIEEEQEEEEIPKDIEVAVENIETIVPEQNIEIQTIEELEEQLEETKEVASENEEKEDENVEKSIEQSENPEEVEESIEIGTENEKEEEKEEEEEEELNTIKQIITEDATDIQIAEKETEPVVGNVPVNQLIEETEFVNKEQNKEIETEVEIENEQINRPALEEISINEFEEKQPDKEESVQEDKKVEDTLPIIANFEDEVLKENIQKELEEKEEKNSDNNEVSIEKDINEKETVEVGIINNIELEDKSVEETDVDIDAEGEKEENPAEEKTEFIEINVSEEVQEIEQNDAENEQNDVIPPTELPFDDNEDTEHNENDYEIEEIEKTEEVIEKSEGITEEIIERDEVRDIEEMKNKVETFEEVINVSCDKETEFVVSGGNEILPQNNIIVINEVQEKEEEVNESNVKEDEKIEVFDEISTNVSEDIEVKNSEKELEPEEISEPEQAPIMENVDENEKEKEEEEEEEEEEEKEKEEDLKSKSDTNLNSHEDSIELLLPAIEKSKVPILTTVSTVIPVPVPIASSNEILAETMENPIKEIEVMEVPQPKEIKEENISIEKEEEEILVPPIIETKCEQSEDKKVNETKQKVIPEPQTVKKIEKNQKPKEVEKQIITPTSVTTDKKIVSSENKKINDNSQTVDKKSNNNKTIIVVALASAVVLGGIVMALKK